VNHLRQTVPPSGTGECCAPKLLQYANTHNLKPLALVEFWYGESPKGEVRHHGMFYEPCQSRCQPIIWWMAGGQEINGLGARYSSGTVFGKLSVLYEDDWFVAVDKPSGMLSVPGKRSLPNVQEIIGCKATHRLDMDTSGILLAAKTDEAFAAMQRLFAQHDEVRKTYRAMLSHGSPSDAEERGTISLPLSSDFLNRPRQCVDYEHGKEAVTDYIRHGNDILLCPRTGRTHQLRMHCAHRDGLNNPILGDPLYGDTPADRMYLHAAKLEFTHPMTGQHIAIESPAPWKIIN
jgi:tRNA pseudouridine32 synthase/23S rRNA pseudouridine746 synthase